MRYERGRIRFDVRCLTDHMLNRYASSWNAGAKRYLLAHSPNVNLYDVMHEYAAVVDVLYGWHRERLYEYQFATLKEWEALAAEFREMTETLEPGKLSEHDPGATFVVPEDMNIPSRTGTRPPSRARAKNNNSKRKKRK
ncbi:hypothetical protein EFK50_07090 [Nocardioides marmoriginsengisoli]|uniref:Uncharacterized protein n=1 Tax=Nocardioides marmoriginsengisoli TaxID=661483 RepID=A0A3N0CMK1_9ACTN|nr:hypothetical protein [Nocardioides marmoriginsengisoli]RNL64286.1 hypothetical protein EFK50_07090 [Nocardioides marmoriginsengisoli]